jgi:hypothetical protein
MLSAWEEGKDLGDVLGLETAIVGTWTSEKPRPCHLAEAQRLINDTKAFDRLVQLQVIHLDDGQATITRPKLVEAFSEIRGYGMEMDKLIDLHEHIVPLIDQISEMLVRFRTQAVALVTATLASSIESTIESLVSQILAEYLEREPDADVG